MKIVIRDKRREKEKMKKLVKDNTIKITMYLKPVFFENSPIFNTVTFDKKHHRYLTDINPERVMNGALSEYGEELEYPIRQEWDSFVEDCRFLIKELGFTIITQNTSEDSKKSEYTIIFGINDDPCGTLVFDLRISNHPFDATFPEELQNKAFEYLKVNKILDADIVKDRVSFLVEKVTVGGVANDSWNRAFNRVFITLKGIRDRIRARLNVERNS